MMSVFFKVFFHIKGWHFRNFSSEYTSLCWDDNNTSEQRHDKGKSIDVEGETDRQGLSLIKRRCQE